MSPPVRPFIKRDTRSWTCATFIVGVVYTKARLALRSLHNRWLANNWTVESTGVEPRPLDSRCRQIAGKPLIPEIVTGLWKPTNATGWLKLLSNTVTLSFLPGRRSEFSHGKPSLFGAKQLLKTQNAPLFSLWFSGSLLVSTSPFWQPQLHCLKGACLPASRI